MNPALILSRLVGIIASTSANVQIGPRLWRFSDGSAQPPERVLVESDAALALQMIAWSVVASAAGEEPGGVVELSGLDGLPAVLAWREVHGDRWRLVVAGGVLPEPARVRTLSGVVASLADAGADLWPLNLSLSAALDARGLRRGRYVVLARRRMS